MIGNHKGGVGKTSVTIQLAAALARMGFRILVVDMDPQANLTRRLGYEYDDDPFATVSEAIKQNADGAAEGVVLGANWVDEKSGEPTAEAQLIDIIPSRFDLINREQEAGAIGSVRRLRKALSQWSDRYDFVLIDTRPDLGHLVQMAMAAADEVLVVFDPEYDTVGGAMRMETFVEDHAVDLGNPTLRVTGYIVNAYDRSAEHDFQLAGLPDAVKSKLFRLDVGGSVVDLDDGGNEYRMPSFIPRFTRIKEADGAGASVSEYRNRRGREVTAIYDRLAERFVDRVITRAEEAA
ncbi:AAA family ATPase (plasmid) [Leifsonia sp. ZF2019]|uniref:ParA family protein n=1 Tax=Leifsonia sp. ZF2019 TaxID=2781978 RepID=UPI0021D95EFB|nr:ParA family protein [Leifsonia sp. ZF2019]UAJ81772.1 AAA family ATPase [Leifsonia sp. ZF2019]